MIPGKLIDTSMSSKPPQGQYNASNMTDEIAEQLLANHPGYAKYFKNYVRESTRATSVKSYKSHLSCAIIIPTRGDRSKFLDYAMKLINRQTVKPDDVIIVDHPAKKGVKDLTERYRIGYELAKRYDVALPWEDDDYYRPTYIETMLKLWEDHPELELIGANTTTYYHIFKKKYHVIQTKIHSSMMCTSIRGGLDIDWPSDDTVFLDLQLWHKMNGRLFNIGAQCLGIKHGVGVCGGRGHTSNLCDIPDPDGSHLLKLTDQESFEFYRNYGK